MEAEPTSATTSTEANEGVGEASATLRRRLLRCIGKTATKIGERFIGLSGLSPGAACEAALYDETFAIKSCKGHRYLVHNRTPHRIRVVDEAHGVLDLPPLAQRVILGARLQPFENGLRSLRLHHQVRVRQFHQPPRAVRFFAVVVCCSAGVLAVIAIHHLLTIGTLERREIAIAAAVTGLLVLLDVGFATVSEWSRRHSEQIADTEEGDIEFGMGGSFYDGNETLRRTKHILTLLLVLVIGAVLPAVAIFVATDAKTFLVMEGGLDVKNGFESQLVGRVIQVVYTAVLSLFPALLFFQFDRHRVGTIRSEWVRSIFRMDERMLTLADVNARYGDELSEASSYSTDSVRLLGGRHSPIIVATVLITLGWVLLVAQTASFDFADPEGNNGFFEVLVPEPSAAAMAFLGAYFFATFLILRSYFRGDLRPKIYSQISARLITVVVLAYLIQALLYESENRVIWTVSFLAGVVPTTVLQRVGSLSSSLITGAAGVVEPKHEAPGEPTSPPDGQRIAAKRPWMATAFRDAFSTPRDLSQLDGLDLHDSTRLETEGINDVPSLAKADLVTLMVSTRLPVDRLVDWIDQAVLVLLLDSGLNDQLDPRVKQLRHLGVRTASSVLDVSRQGPRGPLHRAVREILAQPSDEAKGVTSLAALAALIKQEPAMQRIVQWKTSSLGVVRRQCSILEVRNSANAEATIVRDRSRWQPFRPQIDDSGPRASSSGNGEEITARRV